MKKPFAKRSLGQNFLSDPNYVNKIINALDIAADEMVIEIGPGRGALTEKLAASGADVTAIELDRDLVPLLRERFHENKKVRVIEGDVLEVDLGSLLWEGSFADKQSPCKIKIIANLPYYISTAILQRLAAQRHLFSSLVLMFQREVVERMVAKPCNTERGFLTVCVESAFDVERLFDVPPTAFRPQPKIWSSVVRLTPRSKAVNDEEAFLRLVSAGFAQKRKTLLNNLKSGYSNAGEVLASAGIDPRRRAESLTLGEWTSLASELGF